MTIEFDDIASAHQRIEPFVHQTPVMTNAHLNALIGAEIFFKCENFQKVGAFKARGAFNAVHGLRSSAIDKGVVTHSSGNHAAAVALAAASRNVPAFIVMPTNVPKPKRAAVRGYGATIIDCGSTLEAREQTAQQVQEETGAHFLHPYDDDDVIAGQGTATIELIQQIGGLDLVITPVGGGGLLAGTAIAASHLCTDARIIAGEPSGADDAKRSLDAGRRVMSTGPVETIADGLRATLGIRNFEIVKTRVDDILVVEDDQIVDAMRLIWQYMKLVVEPSAAVPLAALIKHRAVLGARRIGLILSGGNVDLDNLPWVGSSGCAE